MFVDLSDVLILVLMDNTLGGVAFFSGRFCDSVLILVLMDNTLGDADIVFFTGGEDVLILVLMDNTLGDKRAYDTAQDEVCLNPCFNG